MIGNNTAHHALGAPSGAFYFLPKSNIPTYISPFTGPKAGGALR